MGGQQAQAISHALGTGYRGSTDLSGLTASYSRCRCVSWWGCARSRQAIWLHTSQVRRDSAGKARTARDGLPMARSSGQRRAAVYILTQRAKMPICHLAAAAPGVLRVLCGGSVLLVNCGRLPHGIACAYELSLARIATCCRIRTTGGGATERLAPRQPGRVRASSSQVPASRRLRLYLG